MSGLTMADVSKVIAGIDIAMLSTRAANGYVAARPMSNNGDVEYNGDSYFFAFEQSSAIEDIKRDPKIGLSYVGPKGIIVKRVYVAIEADATLIRDQAIFRQHWNKDVEEWASQGVETPGLILIKAHATRIHYWSGHDEHEIDVG